MEQCEICGKEIMGKYPIESAKQCECFVKYADKYMRYHKRQLSYGNTPLRYVKWAQGEERRAWSDLLCVGNYKDKQHWVIKVEVTE